MVMISCWTALDACFVVTLIVVHVSPVMSACANALRHTAP